MIRLIVLLSLFCLTSCASAPIADSEIQSLPSQRELEKDIPNDSWVKSFFEGYVTEKIGRDGKNNTSKKNGGLDELAARNGFPILRETVLPENDLEARVWVGFGKYGSDGFILKRSAGNWSGTVLKGMICHLENKGKYELSAPKSGWDAAWRKLVAAGILVLPDSSKLDKYENGIIDGKGYVVETNSDNLYRTYHYGNPNHVKLKEAGQMVEIGQIIADEFG